jgi:peptide chain release factor 1
MRHRPTGIEAMADLRSQFRSREVARGVLEARVKEHFGNVLAASTNQARQDMVGSGMRGDKIRTYRERDDQVTDHRTGRKVRLSALERFSLEDLGTFSA